MHIVEAPSCHFSFQYVSFYRSVSNIIFLSIKYVELRTNKTAFAGSLNFFLIRRKVLLKVFHCFRKLTVIILHRLKRVNTGFDTLNVVILTRRTSRLSEKDRR